MAIIHFKLEIGTILPVPRAFGLLRGPLPPLLLVLKGKPAPTVTTTPYRFHLSATLSKRWSYQR